MRKPIPLILSVLFAFLLSQLTLSCNNEKNSKIAETEPNVIANNAAIQHNVTPEAIAKDFDSWYTYTYYNINLSQDFIGLDNKEAVVQKDTFLNLLKTGNYFAVKIGERQDLPCYKLYALQTSNEDISMIVKQMAENEQARYHMQGKMLPAFNYTDLQGNRYNETTTKGKIVLVKCWFIHCVACVKEFPELNELVGQYNDRKDVQFISLAMDSKEDLALFLKKNVFKYAVVPVTDTYMTDELRIRSFPTHIVIGKDGKIAHVAGNYRDLVYALNKEIKKG